MAELEKFQSHQVMPIRDADAAESTTTNINSAASTNATSVKATPGTVWSIDIHNYNAAARTLKLYDKASAPIVGTDVPLINITLAAGTGLQRIWPKGLKFNLGIAYAMTTEATIAGTTAVSASDLVGKLVWK